MRLPNHPPFLTIFKSKNDIYCFPTIKELSTTFPSELPKFKKALIIDSSLQLYKVREAKKTGWGNRFYGINLFYKERLIKIELEVESSEKITLENAKTLLSYTIKEKPFGRFMQEFFGNKATLLKKIEGVTNSKELMQLFLEDD